MKSAIGEGMTRKDHSDVSNQLVNEKLTILRIKFVYFHIYLFLLSFSMLVMPLVRMFKQ